jgi:predicted ATPase/DNA-binding winged helix-turn-helix (wHTH) protein
MFSFGRFRADMARRALFVDDIPARLGARAFDVLTALIERRDRVVGKSELLEAVWPNLVVEENNLQVQISALRKLLGSDVIETIPGRGYRFTALLEGAQERATGSLPSRVSSAERAPTNLPVEMAPLYGRDADVRMVQRLVHEHRLVTIAGAGGIGKTRVSLAVAYALLDRFTHGVWVIELAPLAAPELVAASVARVLGHQLRGAGAGESLDELVGLLQAQQLLLVIDNCEHLVDAVSHLAQSILHRAPNVQMLMTSQEPLRLPGERLFRLETLSVPADGVTTSAAQALEHGAVRLFVERAQALDPRFALDQRTLQAVIDICRGLDGLALAIEMAAARVPALGVQGVRERLGERLRMLTVASRTAVRRHQTLRAALGWSYGLLAPKDRVVFRRLGVFSSGYTIEAAQRVTSDGQLDEWAVLDAIGRLVDKSLVVADGADRPRYRMLESVRAYALENLAAAGETGELARRHARYYATYVEHIGEALFAAGGTEDGFIAARAAEFDNVRAAVNWSLGEGGDVGTALALLAHASPMAWVATARAECETWLTALTQRLADVELQPREVALFCAMTLSWGFMTAWHSTAGVDPRGSWATTRQKLQPLGERWVAYCGCNWALQDGWRGDLDTARRILAEVSELEGPGWPGWLPALRLSNMIKVAHMTGELSDRSAELPAMLARLQQEGDGAGRAAFELGTHLAVDYLLHGRFDDGARLLRALAEQGRRQQRDAVCMMFVLSFLAQALTELDRLGEAREVVVELMPLIRWFGFRANYVTSVLAFFAARRGRADTAARLLAAGDARRARIGGRLELAGRHAEQKTRSLLEVATSDDQLSRWFAEGAALSDEEFDDLVIHES